MRRLVAVLFLSVPVFGFSQTVRSPISAGYLGVGAYSNNHVDAFSFQANQASLAKIKEISVGVYGEKRFLLNELSLYDATLTLPTSSGNFGIDALYYGFGDYNESQVGLAYGRHLGSKVDVGVQFNYYNIRIAGYGNASAINFEAGALLHLTEKLNAGVHVYNPVAGKLGKNGEEKLSSIYSVGLGYEASEKFFTSIEIEKEENKSVNVNAGIQYKFLPNLLARAGISAATSSFYFGLGYGWKSVRLDATANYNNQLGITPGLLLLFNVAKKQN